MTGPLCPHCDTANEADARFCEGCGTGLERRCPGCGTTASTSARFCRSCGAALAGTGGAASTPTRKTVTVLFADLAGSTTFEEQVDAETAREVLGEYHDLLRSVAERHRAGLMKFIGDGFMAAWGVPEVGPDDADHAVEAAVDLQHDFVGLAARVGTAHDTTLALRVSVNTGEVVVSTEDADLVGDALNVGARLESECPHGGVVVGEETWRATRGHHHYEPLGRVQVRGRTSAVPVYQWVDRRSEPADSTIFVGRNEEFRRLGAVVDDAVTNRAIRLVTIIGDPGVGKSRLAAAFAGHRAIRAVEIRCAAEGTVALAPLIDLVRNRDIDADLPAAASDRDRIRQILTDLTTGVAASVEETFWALRRYIEELAAGEPFIVVVDDIHWADPQLLDFVEHLIEWVRTEPVVVFALTRPEIRSSRSEFAVVGGWVSDAIALGGLDAAATAQLATQVLGGGRLPAELLARLPASTGGNPLFVREMVTMLVHDGVLIDGPDGWRLTIDADAIAVPPTIQALLASRLERMSTGDRRVLEFASVIGADFSPAAVGALSGLGDSALRPIFDRLRRLEFAQPSGNYLGDEPVWRFHHVLIRDVAYRRLLKSDRAELHERVADWVAAGGASDAADPDELIARHAEAAHGYRLELGIRDDRTATLASRAARGYLAAARRALDRDALASAGAQAARGAALATADPDLHAELLQVACEAFLAGGDVGAGAPFVEELERVADDDLRPWAACYRCQLLVHTDPALLRDVDARLDAVIAEFAGRGDANGSAKAYRVRAAARARLGRVGDAELDLFEALIAARRAEDHRQITAVLGAAPNAALWGPSPVPKAGGRCLDVVRMQRMTTGAPSLEATSLRCLAVLEVLRGRPEKARTMLEEARVIAGDLGLRLGLMETELFAGIVELTVGDAAAAEPHFRTALDGLDVLGVGADAGQAAALLARAVLAQGRVEEAESYAGQSEVMAGHNLKTAIAWRAVRAEILSVRGRHADAVALANEAVSVAADTDLVLDHADACMALSRVLDAAGDPAGADSARGVAESLFAGKGALLRAATGHDRPGIVEESPPPAQADDTGLTTPRPSRPAIRNRCTDVAQKVSHDSRLCGEILAVRGESLALGRYVLADDAGNETSGVILREIGADGLISYEGRFDEGDLGSAIAMLDRRYYAGEGAPFAANGQVTRQIGEALNVGDMDTARRLCHPEYRWRAPESALKPAERTIDEMIRWGRERSRQVDSQRSWIAQVHWASPDCALGVVRIEATGCDDERFHWTVPFVSEFRDGLLYSSTEFADEEEALRYAESIAASVAETLEIHNPAGESAELFTRAMRRRNVDAAMDVFSETCTFDDRRSISGDPLIGRESIRSALTRILRQYSIFDVEVLAVRGQRLALTDSRWSDDSGNTSSYFHVIEVDDSQRTECLVRFDGDDFAGAYRELERRYHGGEGRAWSESGDLVSRFILAMNLDDYDTPFREFSCPDLHVENHTRSGLAYQSAADLHRSLGELRDMLSWMRGWFSAVHWISPAVLVGRMERRGTGHSGEHYSWTRIVVSLIRDGRIAAIYDFDAEDRAAALSCARQLAAD